MEYRWNDLVSNQRVLCETESRPITSIVHQRQLRLYGYVARYQEADPASQVISERDNLKGRRTNEPYSLWGWQVDDFCRELLGMGREPGKGWRRRVGKAMHLSAYVAMIDLL